MADTYDFSKHEKEHYDEYEYSYGTILINPRCTRVLITKTPTGFYGFVKGHRNDSESPRNAADRETFEELGIKTFELPVFP